MPDNNEYQNEAFNIKAFFYQALSYKYFYVACLILCLVIAFMINKFSPTIYQVNSIIGPVENRQNNMLGSNELFRGLGALEQQRNMENDINSLNSFGLVATTIKGLNLEVGYFSGKSNLMQKPRQIYRRNPYTVHIDKSHIQPINVKFEIEILDENRYRLSALQDEVNLYNYIDNDIVSEDNTLLVDTICNFNETITSPNYKFSISLNKSFYNPDSEMIKNLHFEFYHLDQLTKSYLKKLKIEPISIKSTLINIIFQGENLDLTIDFLNRFIQTYLDDNLSKKNRIAQNTITFINSQISDISDSLNLSQSKLREYRSTHQVTDLSFQGQQALEQMSQIENERSTLEVQERYYNYVLDYLNNNQNLASLPPPSSANVVDPLMNTLILELHALNTERSVILGNNAEKNLFLNQIENKIKLQKDAIIENVKNNLNNLNLTQNELNYRAEKLSNEISRLPRTELNMVNMQRQFNLTDAIYTFLLEKQSEAAIAMASNYPDYEVLEPARSVSRVVVSPNQQMNWAFALLIGLLLPTIFIIFKNYFNDKISSAQDLEYLIGRPILNLIYSNHYKTEDVINDHPGSSIAESFRNLRSSLFLKFRSEPLKVIMVTSSQPQDGKSFVSYNLAAAIAAVGHKTIIIDGDLRRPTLHKKFNNDNSIGLSNYMVDHTPRERIIMQSAVANLSFVPAGPVMPNSAELIENGVLDDFVDFLKTKYDYIIIDTTPAGLVADASLLVKYASFILLVCRNNYSRKEVFKDVLNLFRSNNINNFDVVFNDLNIKKSRYGRYNDYYKK